MAKQRKPPTTVIAGSRSTGIAYSGYPRMPVTGVPILPPSTMTHYCPVCMKQKHRVLMHKAGGAWSGTHRLQRFRCPRCGRMSTFGRK